MLNHVEGAHRVNDLTRRALPDDERRAATGLDMALAAFSEGKGDMPLQYVRTFLQVAADEGRSVGEYATRCHVSKSVMSRHILDLSIRLRNGAPGMDLLMTRPNNMELRKHEVFLTPKGRAIAHRIFQAWKMSR